MRLNILIWNSSIIYGTAKSCWQRLRTLNDLAQTEIVTIEFYDDKISVIGRNRKTSIIAKKYIGDPEKLCSLIENKILNAWK